MLTGGCAVRATGGLECLLGGHQSQLLPECLHWVQKANEAALEQIRPQVATPRQGCHLQKITF